MTTFSFLFFSFCTFLYCSLFFCSEDHHFHRKKVKKNFFLIIRLLIPSVARGAQRGVHFVWLGIYFTSKLAASSTLLSPTLSSVGPGTRGPAPAAPAPFPRGPASFLWPIPVPSRLPLFPSVAKDSAALDCWCCLTAGGDGEEGGSGGGSCCGGCGGAGVLVAGRARE